MARSLVVGAVLGGIATFLWSWISWELLPFHTASLKGLRNQDAVVASLKRGAPQSGIYFYPSGMTEPGASKAAKKAAMEAAGEKMKKGPFVFVSIQHRGMTSIAGPMIRGFLISTLGALLITWLLLQTRGLSYMGRVGFVVATAATVWVLGDLPNWNWWGFSGAYTLAILVDLIVGWFLAGLLIARFAMPKGAR